MCGSFLLKIGTFQIYKHGMQLFAVYVIELDVKLAFGLEVHEMTASKSILWANSLLLEDGYKIPHKKMCLYYLDWWLYGTWLPTKEVACFKHEFQASI